MRDSGGLAGIPAPSAASGSEPGKLIQASTPEVNIQDVLEVIRQTDPAAYQEFQQQISSAISLNRNSLNQGDLASAEETMDSLKAKKAAYVKILEQPAGKGLRFRYECEGRSAGSIPGVSSTNENKTFPTIQVVGYKGRAVVVVSCVTSDSPYRPHPHNLVGKEGCKKGVCTLEIPTDSMTLGFQSLGVQCVKKKEIEESLVLRQQIRVDPFQTGFGHRDNPHSLDLNCVRLCFQVFLEGSEKGAFTFALKPVVSEPIFDKKAKNDLIICRMTEYSASVAGGKEMLIFCEKVIKDDIQIRFVQEAKDGGVIWEGYGEFQPSDVHKQYGIAFRTPRYHNLEVDEAVKVKMHLKRPSDGAVSESRSFELTPLDSGRSFWTAKRMKTNYNVFNSILSADQSIRSTTTAVVNNSAEELKRKVRPPVATATTMTLAAAQPPNAMSASFPAVTRNLNLQQQISPDSTTTQQPQLLAIPMPGGGLTLMPAGTTVTLPQNQRPVSTISEASSVVSKQSTVVEPSLNEILSQGEGSVSSFNLDDAAAAVAASAGGNSMSFGAIMKMEPPPSTAEQHPHNNGQPTQIKMDVDDVDLLYDDVMQCVYDDVDTKYDGIDFSDQPPAVPERRRQPQEEEILRGPAILPSPDKPLPGTPSKFKSIFSKSSPRKDNNNSVDESKSNTSTLLRKAKDENGNKKGQDKEVAATSNSNNAVSSHQPQKQSLFQRILKRTKSQSDIVLNDTLINNNSEASSEATGAGVPSLPSEVAQNNNNNNNGGDPTEADLSDLQDFLDSGNLDHLDNMVSEFAQKYLPDSATDSPLMSLSNDGTAAKMDNSGEQQLGEQAKAS